MISVPKLITRQLLAGLACAGLIITVSCGSRNDPGASASQPQVAQKQGKHPGIVEVLPLGSQKKGGATLTTSDGEPPTTLSGEIVQPPEETATPAEKLTYSSWQARVKPQAPEKPLGPRGKFSAAEELTQAMFASRYNSGEQAIPPQPSPRQGPKTKAEELTDILYRGKY